MTCYFCNGRALHYMNCPCSKPGDEVYCTEGTTWSNNLWKVVNASTEVTEELIKAMGKFAPFHSSHEGYAVILEEMEELWDEIKANKGTSKDARAEAKQIAAMAIRYMIEVAKDS